MPRLTKTDVERLASTYDTDPTGALCRAVAIVLGTEPVDWAQMVRSCRFDEPRRSALLASDTAALDRLLRDLIELRELPRADTPDEDAPGAPGTGGS